MSRDCGRCGGLRDVEVAGPACGETTAEQRLREENRRLQARCARFETALLTAADFAEQHGSMTLAVRQRRLVKEGR